MSVASDAPASLHVDVVSDVVCPWCYIGKSRLEMAIGLNSEIAVDINCAQYFLNPWIPREGIDRQNLSRNQVRLRRALWRDRRAHRRRRGDGGTGEVVPLTLEVRF